MEAASTSFRKHHELQLSKNIDRVIPYGECGYLIATYHLNKETQEKSGSLTTVKVA